MAVVGIALKVAPKRSIPGGGRQAVCRHRKVIKAYSQIARVLDPVGGSKLLPVAFAGIRKLTLVDEFFAVPSSMGHGHNRTERAYRAQDRELDRQF